MDFVAPNKTLLPLLKYSPPDWAAPSRDENVTFEVIKQGVIMSTLNCNDFSSEASFLVLGRLPHCDFPFLHESVSRYHAILQWSNRDHPNAPNATAKVYLYDLASAHGTFVNKERIVAHQWIPLLPGYSIRLGASTRLLVVGGEVDQLEVEQEANVQDQGISWGLDDDRDELVQSYQSQSDEGETADSQRFTKHIKDPSSLNDPKKVLAKYFDRLQLPPPEYKTHEESSHSRMFTSLIYVPLEDPDKDGTDILTCTGMASKRREAEREAAQEACAQLMARGCLYAKISAETREKMRKERIEEWDDEMFYDETSRMKKKQLVENNHNEKVLNYDQLIEKKKQNEILIKEIQEELNHLNDKNLTDSEEMDELDAYMIHVQKSISSDKIQELKNKLQKLQEDRQQLQRQCEIAKPTESVLALFDKTSEKKASVVIEKSVKAAPVKKMNRMGPSLAETLRSMETSHSTPPTAKLPIEKLPVPVNTKVSKRSRDDTSDHENDYEDATLHD